MYVLRREVVLEKRGVLENRYVLRREFVLEKRGVLVLNSPCSSVWVESAMLPPFSHTPHSEASYKMDDLVLDQ